MSTNTLTFLKVRRVRTLDARAPTDQVQIRFRATSKPAAPASENQLIDRVDGAVHAHDTKALVEEMNR